MGRIKADIACTKYTDSEKYSSVFCKNQQCGNKVFWPQGAKRAEAEPNYLRRERCEYLGQWAKAGLLLPETQELLSPANHDGLAHSPRGQTGEYFDRAQNVSVLNFF